MRRALGSLRGARGADERDDARRSPFRGLDDGGSFGNAPSIEGYAERVELDATHLGSYFRIRGCVPGSPTLNDIVRLYPDQGLGMFGANIMFDANRMVCLRNTTINGSPTPNGAGKQLYPHRRPGGLRRDRDRHRQQLSPRRAGRDPSTSSIEGNENWSPRLHGRIIRDTATLTANRKLVLKIQTNTAASSCPTVTRSS